ncbi:MAG: sugar transferase [Clostridiales bacterium]|nr:sugar transferase [Clostridiales bacterium]
MSDDIRKRHTVRPGLTGLAQVNGRNSIGWDEKFAFDLKYIEKITIWRDLAILFKTVLKVFKRADINREGTVSDMDYGDWLLAQDQITKEEYDTILENL